MVATRSRLLAQHPYPYGAKLQKVHTCPWTNDSRVKLRLEQQYCSCMNIVGLHAPATSYYSMITNGVSKRYVAPDLSDLLGYGPRPIRRGLVPIRDGLPFWHSQYKSSLQRELSVWSMINTSQARRLPSIWVGRPMRPSSQYCSALVISHRARVGWRQRTCVLKHQVFGQNQGTGKQPNCRAPLSLAVETRFWDPSELLNIAILATHVPSWLAGPSTPGLVAYPVFYY